jgi:hypothetical protein
MGGSSAKQKKAGTKSTGAVDIESRTEVQYGGHWFILTAVLNVKLARIYITDKHGGVELCVDQLDTQRRRHHSERRLLDKNDSVWTPS